MGTPTTKAAFARQARQRMALLAALALAGCANEETLLRNPAGETRYCYNVHNGSLSSIGAVEQYNKCLNEAGAAGFKRVDK